MKNVKLYLTRACKAMTRSDSIKYLDDSVSKSLCSTCDLAHHCL